MIDILLASYNGEKYVETQLLSIISQTYKDWHLIIHDDGSKDSTLGIIRKWSLLDDRITIIEDDIRCGGPAQNFMHLMKYSEAEYVMFCDQDDIWFDNKIELMLKEIEPMDSSKPRVVYSNSYVWKPNIGITGKATLTYASNINELLFLNSGIQGCVAMFDSKVRDLMKLYKGELSMHDHLLQLIAVTMSEVHFIDIPLMLYRNHDKNVTGGTRTHIFEIATIGENHSVPVVDQRHYTTIKSFREIYVKHLSREEIDAIDTYLRMLYSPLYQRLYDVIKHRFKLYGSELLLLIKIIIRPYYKG